MSNLAGFTQVGKGISSILSGITQSDAASAQGRYSEQQFNTQAQLADLAAKQAGISGQISLQANEERTAQMEGQARAAYAASGVVVNTGSAANMQGNIQRVGDINESVIKNRIWEEQFGYRLTSQEDTMEARIARLSSETRANAELAGGFLGAANYGAKAAENFYEGSKAKTGKEDFYQGPLPVTGNPDIYSQKEMADYYLKQEDK